MFAYPRIPPRRRPLLDGPELHVHPHRVLHGIAHDERDLVIVFLRRYVSWCGRARRFDRLRIAIDLLRRSRIEMIGG
jgi:hypothetical protein